MARTTINSQGVPVGTITASDLSYPLTDFSSTGIDDNASSTAITISSGQAVTMSGLSYPTSDGTANQVLTTDGSGALTFADTSSGGVEYVAKATTYTASANEGIIANTSGGAWTLTLPASPSTGDKVFVADGGNWATNNLTVARNGSTIEGSAADFVMDYGGVNVGFIYDGSTWQVYPQAGLLQLLGIDDNATSTAITISSAGNVGIGSVSNFSGSRVVINDTPPTAFGSPMFQVGQETFVASGIYSIGLGYTGSGYTEPPAEIAAVSTSSSGGTTADIIFGTRSVTTNTAVTERMRINSSGNVGIGDGNPQKKLSVLGGILAATSSGSTSGITIDSTATSGYVSTITHTDTGMEFDTGAITRHFEFDGAGTNLWTLYTNTGNINQNYGSYRFAATTTGSDTGSQFQLWGSNGGPGYLAAYQLNFNTGGNNSRTTSMHIDNNGNVAIGTTIPAPIISSSKTLQVASTGNTTLSVRATDGVNDRSAILELLSSGNGASKSIILYGDTDTSPSSPSPLVFQKYHSGSRTEVGRFNTSGHLVLGAATTAFFRLKSGATGTNGGIQWMFNTDATVFGSLTLPYDTRGTTGLQLYSGYPITYTVPSNKAHQFVTGSSEAARIDGDGLKFNGDTAAANALDDYEEGTWSPTLTYAGNNTGQVMTSGNEGNYIKIGSLVTANCRWEQSTKGSSTGEVRISLPFAVADALSTTSIEANGSLSYYLQVSVSHTFLGVVAWGSTSYARFYFRSSDTDTAETTLSSSHVNNGFDGRFTITYRTT